MKTILTNYITLLHCTSHASRLQACMDKPTSPHVTCPLPRSPPSTTSRGRSFAALWRASGLRACVFRFIHGWGIKTRVVATPPTDPFLPTLCRRPLLHSFIANAWYRYAHKKSVAKVLAASQEIFDRPVSRNGRPSPVTNPVPVLLDSRP